ncbi:hypothetical protein CYY_001989 [Polysphondylium violaceum]|uniref:Alpha-1,3-glucosyltransferase n=1 Tax=Polysphondylium violaceum TaxID=133409 RepID=A0A8J4Q0Z9_9MYCE|nr:hypothetical protein CYY_001989 [Polysphondylium violaceum]
MSKVESKSKLNVICIFLTIVCVSILARYLISIHPYSGMGKPPMFGDYEAQRHWMEITTKTPIHQWYFNTTDNDLLYWGLDYPPLTAYLSWIYGKIGEVYERPSMELFTSRGYETDTSKLFMRATVIISDLVVWLPSVWFFVNTYYNDKDLGSRILAFLFISLQPGLLLIDHGHFQYNGVSLGLALFGITFILANRHLVGSAFFVLSLNYKQMSLYYAPAFFFYLFFSNLNLSSLSKIKQSFVNILLIGIVVILSFVLCWLPFLSIEQSSQVLHRLFPFARGLYEDKVANFWCSISILVNLKKLLSHDQIIRVCLITTLTTLIPIAVGIYKKPNNRTVFLYSLVCSAFSFFLFSFQVHEKTILLACMPISLLILKHPAIVWWFGVVSTYSMFPLLFKDQLVVPYLSVMAVYLIIGYQYQRSINASTVESKWTKLIYFTSFTGMLVSHVVFQFIQAPASLPDLWLLGVCCFSFLHFIVTMIYFHHQTFSFNPIKFKSN